MRAFLLTALIATAAVPALAQDRPAIIPTRDVTITYRMNGGPGQPAAGPMAGGITMSWLAAAQQIRVDMGPMGYSIVDHKAQRGFMVMESQRMIMDLPMQQAMASSGLSPNATYQRQGTDTVAGLACTVWNVSDQGRNSTACITADGVLLRAQATANGQSGGMEATNVTYGPQDPARFQRPTGYQTMQAPAMPPGMAAPGARPPG